MILAVTEKKPSKGRSRGRPRVRGPIRATTLKFDATLSEALAAFAAHDQRSKRVIVTLALQEYLEKHNFWPWPKAD